MTVEDTVYFTLTDIYTYIMCTSSNYEKLWIMNYEKLAHQVIMEVPWRTIYLVY